MSRQIVLDTETTGLSADNGDRIIELGCVELLNRRLTGNNLHLFFNPDRDSHEDALKVHGISNEFLKDKPRFAEVVERVIEYLRGAEVIIHNAAFDLGFLDKELALTGRPAFRTHIASVTDTLAMAREMYPGKRNSLDALCERLGVNNSGRILHGALLDAELLADVYIHLTRGQDALLIADDAQESAHGLKVTAIDLRALVLPVVHASAQEQVAHAEVLAQIDKASGGKTIWRSLGSVP
ncbi:DNA polymerase III subunit epsilon [Verminephrobacter aporrectodeae]|uniref:DNA polymerase III subunit epsilon n=1 Tax=Verminephrobacter aporrectodeae TaxID=1110389 RepID=UPI002237D60B|nr:DNA polymerase III subunit epsilon [Verminephrobacter aporrectodeae]MCW5220829.1 DNA polymerase III subunit epsilon [Verminephrobacter aporrectodeae subsp. tuberculatae]MCW5290124.1 DNA polymerase III subunit epsilon [Verminephrobacter aporrectodeae subsp. tuberculatae]MCW8174813.1 DNA polymerase III subunit epsilon [Verminephrobacter aporrectodeae subsp. tuberculatae]MCW8197552.1 DNA polymerase III subunit epsilon [Verminephrobacter aporrectodeae subsp. tuberculatae]MCW8202445.1 DNA polyme